MPDSSIDAGRSDVLDRPLLLSERQREVLGLAAEGLTVRAIALRLTLSVKTVEKHLGLATRALNAVNTTNAVAIALQSDLIEFHLR